MADDIRWRQRFANYQKALGQLRKFIEKNEASGLNELEEQGLIKAFEYTYELGWNMLKDFLEYQGRTGLAGSRDTIREAFKVGLIGDGEGWMQMLQNRNRTSHTYNEATADAITDAILHGHFALFEALDAEMTRRMEKE